MIDEKTWPTYSELPSQKNMPDCTVDQNGKKIESLEQWEEYRVYLKEMFSHYMYGHAPKSRGKITANTTGVQAASESSLKTEILCQISIFAAHLCNIHLVPQHQSSCRRVLFHRQFQNEI